MGTRAAAFLAYAGADRVQGRASLQRDGQASASDRARGARGRVVIAGEGAAALYGLGQAIERLEDPRAIDDLSSLNGVCAFVAEVDTKPAISSGSLARARQSLAALAVPSVALCARTLSAEAEEWADLFDVRVDSHAMLERLVSNLRGHPIAALSLVQLLRGAAREIHEGLVAESWAYSVLQAGPEFSRWREAHATTPARGEGQGPAVRVERAGDRLSLVLNRPQVHNAFSVEMRDALVEALQLVVFDDGIREVLLRGEGPSFCSGGFLDEFGSLPDPATAHVVRSTRNAARLLAWSADRVRAEVHGACVGAGVELPAFASHVAARAGAFFQLPEISMGLVPGAGGTVSLPRRIGRQRTAWMALSGERIDAETALAWGLVDQII